METLDIFRHVCRVVLVVRAGSWGSEFFFSGRWTSCKGEVTPDSGREFDVPSGTSCVNFSASRSVSIEPARSCTPDGQRRKIRRLNIRESFQVRAECNFSANLSVSIDPALTFIIERSATFRQIDLRVSIPLFPHIGWPPREMRPFQNPWWGPHADA